MEPKSEDIQFVWHPYTQMLDWQRWDAKVIAMGKGFRMIDEKGVPLLDGIANMWCNVWGYDYNPIIDAMINQLRSIAHSSQFGLSSSSSAALAHRLVDIAKGMSRVFFTDNGSSAIEAALKMALQFWRNKGNHKKTKFISLQHGYHGDTAGAMSVGYVEDFFSAYSPLLRRQIQAPTPLLYGSGYANDDELVSHCIDRTEKILKRYSSRCAALVMESGAQIAGGVIIYPKGYQRAISELCNKYGVLLVLDEIATGFGRLGNLVEYVAQSSAPDIVCFGKALTGGYFPLAVTLASKEVFDGFLGNFFDHKQLFHGHTFTGHNVGCAAALANLDLYMQTNLIARIRKYSEHMGTRLEEFRRFRVVSDIRTAGLLAGIELAKNGRPIRTLKNGQPVNYFIMKEAQKMGVFLRPLGNIMMFVPPLAIGLSDLDEIIDTGLALVSKIDKLS